MSAVIDLCSDSSDEEDDVVFIKETKKEYSKKVEKVNVQERKYMPGEAEAIERNQTRSWVIKPSRDSDDSDPSEYHYRICESQWNRTLGPHRASYELKSVEYHVNPRLRKRFEAKKAEYDARFGTSHTKILGFHGTAAKNVEGIMKEGFKLSKVGSATDPGYYGNGIYFSEFVHVSLAYCQGGDRMLLCRVLLGKPYPMANVKLGASREYGYTSHINNNNGLTNGIGTEVVIFDEAAILPIYSLKFDKILTTAGPSPLPPIAMPTMSQALAAGKTTTNMTSYNVKPSHNYKPPIKKSSISSLQPPKERPRKRPLNTVRNLDGSASASAMNQYFKMIKKQK